ncbi:hypothetical protein FJ364_04025, partial [Candidatus Dependentiae bacterium]|nr:hypothetical protein [Candidatus Dependentiae bacterium]
MIHMFVKMFILVAFLLGPLYSHPITNLRLHQRYEGETWDISFAITCGNLFYKISKDEITTHKPATFHPYESIWSITIKNNRNECATFQTHSPLKLEQGNYQVLFINNQMAAMYKVDNDGNPLGGTNLHAIWTD